jgi:glycosyltransferase involved in cell wall biosynthesis
LLSQFIIHNSLFMIQKQKRQGAAAARNLGAKIALGDILAFTDSDCFPPNDWLKKISDPFVNPKIGAVGGGYSSGADNTFWQKFCSAELAFRQKDRPKEVTTLLSNNFACLKSAFIKAGGFPKNYRYGEDMLLSYNISRFSKLWWLKNNGVKHYFRNSLLTYLKHQYSTGRGSVLFFLENPPLLFTNHYQGKRLHLAIAASFLILLNLVLAFFIRSFWLILPIPILIHLFIYLGFLIYLKKRKFSDPDLLHSYSVSLLRDIICALSFFSGFYAYIKKRV